MNLLFISKYPPIEGGVSSQTYWLAKALGQKGHKIYVASNCWEVEPRYREQIEENEINLLEPNKLTEGDWIVKDVYVGKQYICGPKDLGISKIQIRKLIQFYKQRKVKKILIKEGIPFVPSFLIAFIAALIAGNPLQFLI